jgi:hypothetical protein
MKTRAPLSGLAKLTLIAFVGMGIGFLGGELEGIVKAGVLFVPPLVVGTLSLLAAGLVATRVRWLLAVAAVYATVMLLGAATLGESAVLSRLTNPADVMAFLETWVQMPSTVVAAIAGVAATVQQYRTSQLAEVRI